MSSLTRLVALLATICAMGALAASAFAAPANPNPGSPCSADGIYGTINIVIKDGVPIVTGCIIQDGNGVERTIQFSSGSCHYVANPAGKVILVCTKQ